MMGKSGVDLETMWETRFFKTGGDCVRPKTEGGRGLYWMKAAKRGDSTICGELNGKLRWSG